MYQPRTELEVPKRHIAPGQVAGERDRLAAAVRDATRELEDVRRRILSDIGESASEILTAHVRLVSDPGFLSNVQRRISSELIDAESAVQQEAEAVAHLFSGLENEYLRERAHDIFDVKLRLLRHLGHWSETTLEHVPPRTVLVARDLLPSDTLNLDRAHVAGVVLELGASMGHAAILARSMGIPAVGGVPDLLHQITDGVSLLVDGERGEVVVDPEPPQITSFAAAREAFDHASARALSDEWKACVTADGHAIDLYANIGRPSEVDQVRRHFLQGIGLFRTEYLFLGSTEPPSLEYQREVYREVLARAEPSPVVIRTLDLGGDKKPRFSIPHFHPMTNLGARGLLLSLREDGLFRVQLRAIMEARREGQLLSILLPMVLGAEDLKRAMIVIEEVAAASGPGRSRPPVGAMIETPSALFELDEILALADFVSLGTNDLAQFMLAMERRSSEALGEEAIFYPAMLRAVAHVIRAAKARGKPLTICGEAAGDPRATCLFVGFGAERFSMSPVRAARVRAAIRRYRRSDLEALSARALQLAERGQILELVER